MKAVRRGFALALVVALLVAPSHAFAMHSVPGWPVFWDKDSNGIPNSTDSVEYYQTAGTLWTSSKIQRLQAAISRWTNGTDWNPAYSCCSTNGVYINGATLPACFSSWNSASIAATCLSFTNRGSYGDIFDTDISLNEVHWNFSWSASEPPSGFADAQGVSTHELGHGIFLLDLSGTANCPPGPTMCGVITSGQLPYTMDLRTLTSDDVSSANYLYLP